jgi:hypothetical protein
VVGVHVTPTVFFNVRKTIHRKKFQGTDHCPREWKSVGSAVASLQLSGENGWQRTWFDGPGHRWGRMHDMLGFICGVYMGRLDRGGPGAGEGVGKTNHISFQNFHYEAAVGPSEQTGKACPCDREKEWRGNEKKKKTDHGYVSLRNGKNGKKSPNAAPPLLHEYIAPRKHGSSQRPPGSELAKRNR